MIGFITLQQSAPSQMTSWCNTSTLPWREQQFPLSFTGLVHVCISDTHCESIKCMHACIHTYMRECGHPHIQTQALRCEVFEQLFPPASFTSANTTLVTREANNSQVSWRSIIGGGTWMCVCGLYFMHIHAYIKLGYVHMWELCLWQWVWYKHNVYNTYKD
jgi:hypothetical protein